jgi:membrane protein DedA with SNARE-associated domain
MDISGFIQHYGYFAVFVGTLLEGEAILLIAGFAAHRGYLALQYVIAVAIVAAVLGNQLFFMIGRMYGSQLLARFPSLAPQAARATALLDRYHLPLTLLLRFLYGLRIAVLIAIGMTPVPWYRFLVLDLIGAVAWVGILTGLGYVLGNALEWLLADLRRYEAAIIAALALLGAGWWLRRHLRSRARISR